MMPSSSCGSEWVRLDAARAFADGRDARIAQVLRGAGLLDEAHAAMDLHAERRDVDGALGAHPATV
jgi:hypothetical protein